MDLVADGPVLRTHVGGGPLNAAVALARLDVPVGLLCRISDDAFGRVIGRHIASSGISNRYVLTGPEPTPLAIVNLSEEGDAEYAFYLDGTADRLITPDVAPPLGADVVALHFGSLSLVTEPAASTFEAMIAAEAGTRLILLDPNIRPAIAGDRMSYLRRLERFVSHVDVVKLSEADAEWLWPGRELADVGRALLAGGTDLAVITRGGRGALAVSRAGAAECAAPVASVVDTVGAGDAFGAGVLRWLDDAGRLRPGATGGLGATELAAMLSFAGVVAALTCTRAGADPPHLDDVHSAMREMVPR